jgi:DNA-binding NarL/FixJ family response regulator
MTDDSSGTSIVTEAPRTLLADDHMMVAEGLNRLLADHCQMVGTVLDGTSLVEAAVDLQPDLIIADLSMPGLSGLDAISQLRARGVTAKIIILTMYADPRIAKEAIAAGAVGFVSKHAAGQELVSAIHEVVSGRTYLSPEVAERLGGFPLAEKPLAKLTPRQRQVLQLIAKGYRMREIAGALQVSPRTVETHKYEIMRVLGFKNTADLVRYATWLGLVGT